ncbi:TRAP transporter small permease [Roseivivax sp. CAU 1761]
MHVVRRALDVATTVTAWIGGLAATAMMLHVTADVIGRTFFNRPLTGTVEIVSAYNMAALAFLPLALIARERGHIIVDLFTQGMKWRWRTLLDGAVGIVTFVYVAVFTWKAIEVAIDKTHIREAKEAGTGFVEIWPSRWLVVAGFGLMALYVLVFVARDLRAGVTGRPDPNSPETHTDPEGDGL